ncbi:MAG: transposase [Chryseobacterium sp.]|nr:MAG: transposase [Chryseobacterium sp.]
MSKRVFDDSFKKMAIDLSNSRGSVKEVADELGINDSLLSKWRQRESEPKQSPVSLTEDQKLIKKLQKELKDAQMERDILKKAVGIFSKGDGRYSDL